MGAKKELSESLQTQLAPARANLKIATGPTGQMILPGVDYPAVNVPRGTPAPAVMSGQQPAQPAPAPTPAPAPAPANQGQPGLIQFPSGPSQLGLTQGDFGPRPDTEDWVWGTMKHLTKGVAVGVSDLIKGIIDIDAENRALKEEMYPMIDEYVKATPERKAELEKEVGIMANRYADSWTEKLGQHGVMLAKDMAIMTIQAPFKTVARGLSFIDSGIAGVTGEKDAEELKKEWFTTLDNIVPIAMDAVAFLGGLKAVKAMAGGKSGVSGAEIQKARTLGVKNAEALTPEQLTKHAKDFDIITSDPNMAKMPLKESRAILQTEKANLMERYKAIADIERKEIKQATRKQAEFETGLYKEAFKETGKAKGELQKLIIERAKLDKEYKDFISKKTESMKIYETEVKANNMDFDLQENIAYGNKIKSEIEVVKQEIKKLNEAGKKPEAREQLKKLKELKIEEAEVRRVNDVIETVYKADYLERQYKGRLDSVDRLIELKNQEIQTRAMQNKTEAIGKLKENYASQKKEIINRIKEINREVKGLGKKGYTRKAVEQEKPKEVKPPEDKPDIKKVETEDMTTGDLFRKDVDKAESVKAEDVKATTDKAVQEEFKFAESPDMSPEVKEAGKGINFKNMPDTMRQFVKGVMQGKRSLPGIYKDIQKFNLADYVYKRMDPSKITGLFSNAIEFLKEVKIPEIAVLADWTELKGSKMASTLPEFTKKLDKDLKKTGINKEKFFSDYEAGKYSPVFDKYNNKTLKMRDLTLDEQIALRVYQFTEFFADVFELKTKIGPHGKPLYRKNYLPHMTLKDIAEKLKERKGPLTADELAIYNAITGQKFKNIYEIPRYMDLPFNPDPFVALESYGQLAIKKMLHDTHLKIFEETRGAVRQLKNKANEELKILKEREKNIRDAMDKVEDKPEALKKMEEELGAVRKEIQTNPKLNEAGFDSVEKRLNDIIDRVTEQSTFEDRLFFRAMNAKNPVANFVLNAYLKTPFIKKPYQLKEAKVVDKGNTVEIEGKLKNEAGQWETRSFTLKEFLGKRPLTKMLTNYKALSYASILGMSIPSTITNLTQTLSMIAQLPGNKMIPILPSLTAMKAVADGFGKTLKSLVDKKQRVRYTRSGIFVTMDRLYDGEKFSEGKLGNILDGIMLNMKFSEYLNRVFTYETARSALLQKNGKLKPSQKVPPRELDILAREMSDAINFKYTPLHTEQLLATNTGKLAFHFGSFFVKQLKLVGGMAKKEWRNPAVQKFYKVMQKGDDAKGFLNRLNNDGRMAVMRWLILSTSMMTASKALFDVWLWQVDPRRQLFFNPLENPLVKTPFELAGGIYDLLPTPIGNPERGFKTIERTVGKYIPLGSQFRRTMKALEKNEPGRIIFSSMGFEDESPAIQ